MPSSLDRLEGFIVMQACLFWIDMADPSTQQQCQGLRLERLERSRELCRNICNAVGIKPSTELCAKWWQIITAVQLIHSGTEPDQAIIPYDGMGPCENKPITHLCSLHFVHQEDFTTSLELVTEIFPDDARFKKDLVSTLTDLIHVAFLHEAHQDPQAHGQRPL